MGPNTGGIFFMRSLLEWIEKGGIIRTIFSIILKIAAVLFALSGVGLFLANWGYITEVGIFGSIGFIVAQILLLITFYMIVHTLWIRSSDVDDLNTGNYTVIPIFSIVSKLGGELAAIFSIMGGLMSGTLILFLGAYQASGLISRGFGVPGFEQVAFALGRNTLTGAISAVAGGVLVGFVAMLIGYLWSEAIIVLVDIAESLTKENSPTHQ